MMAEEIRKFFACLCCLLVSGPIMIIIGIVVFQSSFTDTRKALVTEYNAGVVSYGDVATAWTANNGYSVFLAPNGTLASNLVWSGSSTTGGLSDSHTDYTKSYTESIFSGTFAQAYPKPTLNADMGMALTINGGVKKSNATTSFALSVVPATTQTVTLSTSGCSNSRSSSSSSSSSQQSQQQCMDNKCRSQGGTPAGTSSSSGSYKCIMRAVISSVCLKVGANMQVSQKYGGPGCYYNGGTFGAVNYKTTTLTFPVQVALSSIPVVVSNKFFFFFK
jgi:hypothetical protein